MKTPTSTVSDTGADERPGSKPWRPPLSRGADRSTCLAEGATVLDTLRYLGFEEAQCEMAARRSLSMEAAVEWLSAQKAVVQL